MAILALDEVWLREPRLLVPGQQPCGPVKIDYSNPIAARCFGALVGGTTCVGSRFVISERRGGVTASGGVSGLSYKFDGADDAIICKGSVLRGKAGDLGVFGVCEFDGATTSSGRWFSIGNGLDTGFGLGSGGTQMDNAGTNFLGLLDGKAWITSSTAVPTGVNSFAWSSPANNSHICYLNGSQIMTSSTVMTAVSEVAAGSGVTVSFGGSWGSTTFDAKIALPLLYIFDRALRAVEVADLHRNPYQLLTPA